MYICRFVLLPYFDTVILRPILETFTYLGKPLQTYFGKPLLTNASGVYPFCKGLDLPTSLLAAYVKLKAHGDKFYRHVSVEFRELFVPCHLKH